MIWAAGKFTFCLQLGSMFHMVRQKRAKVLGSKKNISLPLAFEKLAPYKYFSRNSIMVALRAELLSLNSYVELILLHYEY